MWKNLTSLIIKNVSLTSIIFSTVYNLIVESQRKCKTEFSIVEFSDSKNSTVENPITPTIQLLLLQMGSFI